jgi:putative tryptophan/tyrosine transport system substrate-binding protein
MKRREFISLLGAGAVAWPVAARSQQAGKVYRIGFLGGADPVGYADQMEALRLGLRDHGYVDGKNTVIEERWAEGKYDRLPALAAELVQLKVDVIITHGTPAALAAKQATPTVPIVMAIVGNPVEAGIVASLPRPGGNITGSSFFVEELNAKRLEVMKDVMPGLSRAGVLINLENPAMAVVLRAMQDRARSINVELRPVNVQRIDDLDGALKRAKAQTDALIVIEEGLLVANAKRIAELAITNRLPSIGFKEYCEAGGLIAYGVDFRHTWRQSMVLVDKILKGAKPAELPIQQATRFVFIINLKTAKTLSLTIPPTLLARADELIE